MNVSIGLAFIGGLVSFFSPCVLPVIPAYFSFLVGTSIAGQIPRRVLLVRSVFFVLGFSTIFVLLGASASAAGRLIGSHRPLLMQVGGAIVIIFGLHMLGLLKIPWLMMEKRVHLEEGQKAGGDRAFVLGLSFAAGWTPCIGPVLSSILFLAGSSGGLGWGTLLLGIYSLGMAVPFLLFALLAEKAVGWIRRNGRVVQYVQWLGGGIMILLGITLLFGWLGRLSALIPIIPLPF